MNTKIRRIMKSWNQDELAKEANVSISTIVKIEKGNIEGISLGILKKVAKALDCNFDELFLKEK